LVSRGVFSDLDIELDKGRHAEDSANLHKTLKNHKI